MDNLHLVTGFLGREHITAADQGAFNTALIGTGQFVLEKGNVFEAQVISNNLIRVLDGELMMQGRFIRINPNEYVDLTIENGEQGLKRNDLIVVRYTKDTISGVESTNLVVIKGEAVANNPVDPAITEGDITNGKAVLHEFPLWRIPINGLNVGEPVSLFGEPFMDSMRTLPGIRRSVETIHSEVDAQLAEFDERMEQKIATIDSYTKEETLSDETKATLGLGKNAVPSDAFDKLSESVAKVGDVIVTQRTDLSEQWVLCNGEVLAPDAYPKLKDIAQLGTFSVKMSYDTVVNPKTLMSRVRSGDSLYVIANVTVTESGNTRYCIYKFTPSKNEFTKLHTTGNGMSLHLAPTDDGRVYAMGIWGEGYDANVYVYTLENGAFTGKSYNCYPDIPEYPYDALYSKADRALVFSGKNKKMFILYLDTNTKGSATFNMTALSNSTLLQGQFSDGQVIRVQAGWMSSNNVSTWKVVVDFYAKATSTAITKSVTVPLSVDTSKNYPIQMYKKDGAYWLVLRGPSSDTTIRAFYKISTDGTVKAQTITEAIRNDIEQYLLAVDVDASMFEGVMCMPSVEVKGSSLSNMYNVSFGLKTPTISTENAYAYIKVKE